MGAIGSTDAHGKVQGLSTCAQVIRASRLCSSGQARCVQLTGVRGEALGVVGPDQLLGRKEGHLGHAHDLVDLFAQHLIVGA